MPVPVPARVTVRARCGRALKVAVTAFAASVVTWQAPVPVQEPLQPAKADPATAVGVSVTGVPSGKSCAHVAPQLIPAGALTTVPAPVPVLVTVSVRCWALWVNVAVTLRAALMVTWHVPVPVQSPLQ